MGFHLPDLGLPDAAQGLLSDVLGQQVASPGSEAVALVGDSQAPSGVQGPAGCTQRCLGAPVVLSKRQNPCIAHRLLWPCFFECLCPCDVRAQHLLSPVSPAHRGRSCPSTATEKLSLWGGRAGADLELAGAVRPGTRQRAVCSWSRLLGDPVADTHRSYRDQGTPHWDAAGLLWRVPSPGVPLGSLQAESERGRHRPSCQHPCSLLPLPPPAPHFSSQLPESPGLCLLGCGGIS